jgi:hypothetical protein
MRLLTVAWNRCPMTSTRSDDHMKPQPDKATPMRHIEPAAMAQVAKRLLGVATVKRVTRPASVTRQVAPL